MKYFPVNLYMTGDYRSDMKRIAFTLAHIDEGLEPSLEKNLLEAAQFMKTMAQAYCPVYPVKGGSLQRSIRVERIAALAVRVRAGGYVVNPRSGRLVDYAKFVEEGTRKMMARPFMRPAWNHTKNFVMREVESSMMRLANV
jgi:HK97 gp10 family phage protein